ncbi:MULTISPECIES: NAD(P)H-dependent glycerol-3-phosphate dehydrogenase [Cryobacterium]|uniref:NAD(P)H-dependent glycerol-3-phosphate dehydrogenase n=1 Tax=unclassified Cryobacterium TaxID=2649013 RepID=UPI001F5410CA|nr:MULTISPECIES: NAD(P)H-dependent glycerol-3-phosphate dehydrogenase [Cryobacterium]MDY7528207.1 NAD(P)H-dependent glycerol-3-phosphate dehydrogenase [Cryobacterium sp. 10C2]MDY7556046.1 NAD(P)H-dependent glycerol-3-phosphate dehydrogenase [Cryobacterium sp. 10C3]MEB0003327.1 NAD(P)H-dependent glycerol-3-phosphate dehydrogenase [Cryobacterium sp. RTC2.1]MEB0200887.1 NAD(P)H-dependent glycerol-3-phosphate dehydrogenase [Cryobacterium sp. 5I3]MEB0289294.1 NAD(P)H-dependent glycerol-3-phosphate 
MKAKQRQGVPVGTRVAVLGAGSWGTTFAKILSDGGADVVLWARRPELAREITEGRRNSDYLPGINLPIGLRATPHLDQALAGAEQVFISVPSQSLRENLVLMEPFLEPDAILVSLMKGVERGSGQRMSQIIEEMLPVDPHHIAAISGPNLALEIAREQPTAAVVSSTSLETAQAVAILATNSYFRSYVNTDVIGTEFGGVLKNLIAVAIGIVDGVGYGENTKASIITRGLVEMTDFAVAYGAQPETLAGLAGLGDLIATCQSPLSRNNTAGRLLGQGYSIADVVKQMQQTTEGLASVGPILDLARAKGVDMPIVEQVRQVLAGTLKPRDIAPHLTTDSAEPQGERTIDDGQAHGSAALWGSVKRTLDQLRHGRRSPGGN